MQILQCARLTGHILCSKRTDLQNDFEAFSLARKCAKFKRVDGISSGAGTLKWLVCLLYQLDRKTDKAT